MRKVSPREFNNLLNVISLVSVKVSTWVQDNHCHVTSRDSEFFTLNLVWGNWTVLILWKAWWSAFEYGQWTQGDSKGGCPLEPRPTSLPALAWGPGCENVSLWGAAHPRPVLGGPSSSRHGKLWTWPQAWGRVGCPMWLWPYLQLTYPTPGTISQTGLCTSWLSFVFVFPLILSTQWFRSVSPRGLVVLESEQLCSFSVSSQEAIIAFFFFFNLKRFRCAVKLIKPCTALSINFMVYEFSILWTRNPSAEDLCLILGNPAATALQSLYY